MKNPNLFRTAGLTLFAALSVSTNVNAQGAPVPPSVGSGCYATSVSSFNQGLTALGTAVNAERSISVNALGAPNGQNPSVYAPVQNFVSLGLGGSIVIEFADPIANGPGNDIIIWESSASVNNERGSIEVSQDGLGFVPVATINQGGQVDFADVFSDYIRFVRITDVTPVSGGGQVTDGFDLDAVECMHGAYVFPCYANEVVSFNQKKQNDGSTVSSARSNPSSALGAPENNDTQNFVSLGFGGDITQKFGNPIKNGAGNDLRVIESTFGSINSNRYPERVRVFASQDNCHFVYLGEGCQDADFDLGALNWAQYIKLVDASPVNAI